MEDYKGGYRYNLSFASKFCAYACEHLDLNDYYSKYDNVVSNILPTYIKLYLNEDIKKSLIRIQQSNSKSYKTDLERRISIYINYNNFLGRLIDELKKQRVYLDRNRLDHLLWYGYKGKKS